MFWVDQRSAVANFRTVTVALLLFAAILVGAAKADDKSTLTIGGTGSALGGMKLLATAYMKSNPEVRVVVLPSLGSGGGIKALLSDKVDISLSSRPLKPAEQTKGIVATEYARSPIVFATHHESSVVDVKLDELPPVYSGDSSTWPDGSRLRLIMRPASESDTKLLRSLSPQMDKAVVFATKRTDLLVATNDQKNADALEQVRGSLGVTTLAQTLSEGRQLKTLSFDGQKGTLEALRDGKYAFAKKLHLVTREEPSTLVASFLKFVRSAKGTAVLGASGHLVSGEPEKPNT